MSRRVRNDEIELGSDSFLDIIANIVGILIILIVIAGVKVARQPAVVEPVQTAAVEIPEEVVPEPIIPPALPVFPTEPEPEPVVEEPAKPQFGIPRSPSRYVAAPQNKTQPRVIFADSLDQKEAGLKQFAERRRIMNAEITRLASIRRQASTTLDGKMTSNTAVRTELAALQNSLQDKRAEAAALRRRLNAPIAEQVDLNQIEHKVTPVGRAVTGPEIHFRLAGGKVSYVPVEELVSELKSDASRKQSALMSSSSYRGRVGPIRGYRMKYEIARKRDSLGTLFRVIVNEWEVEPTADLEAETVQQAQRSGSLFDRRLLTLSRDANVTFWVYPDSFSEYRTLQSRVHRDGLTVAGRPLPFGVPIAGSPNGTKSSGQ